VWSYFCCWSFFLITSIPEDCDQCVYTVSKKRPLFYLFEQLCQKLTDFNDFCYLNPEKIWHENLTHWSISPVRCSHVTLKNPKKSFSTVLFIHTSDYLGLRYLRRKQTVVHLPTPPANGTTLTCELQNFFHLIEGLLRSFKRWKLRRASCGLWSEAAKRTGCDVWQLECQASNVTASVQSDQLLHASNLFRHWSVA